MPPPDDSPEKLPGLGRISRYFWPHVRQHRGLIAGSMVALFAEVGLRLLEPWPLKFVFDRILLTQPNRPSPFPSLDQLEPMTLLALAAIAVVVITGLRALAAFWQTIGFAKIGTRVLRKVREQVFRHVQYLSLSFHTSARTGDLVVRMMGDVAMLQDVAVTAFLPLIAKALIVAGMIGLMFFLNWKLALIAAATAHGCAGALVCAIRLLDCALGIVSSVVLTLAGGFGACVPRNAPRGAPRCGRAQRVGNGRWQHGSCDDVCFLIFSRESSCIF